MQSVVRLRSIFSFEHSIFFSSLRLSGFDRYSLPAGLLSSASSSHIIALSSEGVALAHAIKTSCYDMFQDYKLKSVDKNSHESATEIGHNIVESPNDSRHGGRRYMMVEMFKIFNYGRDDTESKTDLEKCLAEDSENMQDGFDILAWWKVNAPRFHILSQMARDILAIPISTVASESTFSTGGRVLDAFRSSLSPKIVQSLICAQDWMRAKWTSEPVNVEENIRDIDKFDEDLSKITFDTTTW